MIYVYIINIITYNVLFNNYNKLIICEKKIFYQCAFVGYVTLV